MTNTFIAFLLRGTESNKAQCLVDSLDWLFDFLRNASGVTMS
jgi:hypothetical protein